MKKILNKLLLISTVSFLFFGCKKEETRTILKTAIAPALAASSTSLVLTQAHATDTSEIFSWTASQYGFIAAVNYTIQIAKGGTNFANPQKVNIPAGTLNLKLAVSSLNTYAIASGLSTGSAGSLDIRVASKITDSIPSVYSNTVTITVTPYQAAYPALLVQGGNSWVTPSTYTPAYILSSPGYSNNYEGYLYLPDADGYHGDAFKLISSTTGTVYGWGGNGVAGLDASGNPNTTAPMAVGAGNLWIPHNAGGVYMKINVDVTALTMSWMPISFFITGDDNGWSTSATPMTFNPATNKWVATGVTLTAGKSFAFTSNYGWNFNYRVDPAGHFIYGGPPGWAGVNVPITASGTFTVTLDLSGGNGSYTYSIQ